MAVNAMNTCAIQWTARLCRIQTANWVMLFVAVFATHFLVGCRQSLFDPQDVKINAIKTEDNAFNIADRYANLYRNLTHSRIIELAQIDDQSISIQTEWQIAISNLISGNPGDVDPFDSFFDRLDNITGVPAPDWWGSVITDSEKNAAGYYELGNVSEKQLLFKFDESDPFGSPKQ